MNLRFCFKVSKEVGLAEDENGNPGEAYVCAKSPTGSYNVPSDDYKNAQEGMRIIVSKQIGCELDLITPITLNEYLDNTEEDE